MRLSSRPSYHAAFFGILFLVFFSAHTTARAESVFLKSEDARWIANMIFQNECSLETDCLVTWNDGEEFLSLGIGHFIWYPSGQTGVYRESFTDMIKDLETHGQKLPDWLRIMIQNGPPWKTREEFLAAKYGREAKSLRDFLKETMSGQALFMIHRFQSAIARMIQIVKPEERTVLAEKILALTQTRNGMYAMIDYINFKGDGLADEERYHAFGWGLFQVLNEMNWPAGAGGPEAEFVEAARKVLRRRVDNAPSERSEDRWITGWVKRVETYSSTAVPFSEPLQGNTGLVGLENIEENVEILNFHDRGV